MDPAPTAAHEDGEQHAVRDSTENEHDSNELSRLQELLLNLNECNWEQLEERYAHAMDEHSAAEEILRAEMAELFEVSCRGLRRAACRHLMGAY